jgi:hypothetical protein
MVESLTSLPNKKNVDGETDLRWHCAIYLEHCIVQLVCLVAEWEWNFSPRRRGPNDKQQQVIALVEYMYIHMQRYTLRPDYFH